MLVENASAFAAFYGVSPMVIGLTIVAFGTSVPELTVSVVAALKGPEQGLDRPGIDLGAVRAFRNPREAQGGGGDITLAALGAADTYGPSGPRVHIIEGEGGLTPGRVAEAMAAGRFDDEVAPVQTPSGRPNPTLGVSIP